MELFKRSRSRILLTFAQKDFAMSSFHLSRGLPLLHAFQETARQTEHDAIAYHESLRQALPEQIPSPYDKFDSLYPTIRSSLLNVMQTEDQTNSEITTLIQKFRPFAVQPGEENLQQVSVARNCCDLLSTVCESFQRCASSTSAMGHSISEFASHFDSRIEPEDDQLQSELTKLKKHLKIDKIEPLSIEDTDDDFVVIGTAAKPSDVSLVVDEDDWKPDEQIARPEHDDPDLPLNASVETPKEVWPIASINVEDIGSDPTPPWPEPAAPREKRTRAQGTPAGKKKKAAEKQSGGFIPAIMSWFDAPEPPQRRTRRGRKRGNQE